MAYVAKTSPHAERDLAELYRAVDAELSYKAMEWYLGIKEAILSLEQQPNRRPIIRKTYDLQPAIRANFSLCYNPCSASK
jgi:hypothetical protein